MEAARLGYADIRPPHAHVLAHTTGRGIRLTDLAARAQLSLAAVSEFVTELEELGYLERRPDPDDGRAKLIVPTPRGRQAFKDGARGVAEIERRWASLVGGGAFEHTCGVMQRLLDEFNERGLAADNGPRDGERARSPKTPLMQSSVLT